MEMIFLVEDNQDNADLVADMLADEFEVRCFPDASSTLAALGNSTMPSLFLLDISLPGMDGVTLLKRIREMDDYRGIPAVALTAHAMKSDRESFMAHGFNDYVSKPITDETILLEKLRRLLKSS